MLQLGINVFTGSNFKNVTHFINVTKRHGFELHVREVSCM